MGDTDIAEEVVNTSDPKEQKNLGRKVKNFDEDLWNAKCFEVVKQGNIHKVCPLHYPIPDV